MISAPFLPPFSENRNSRKDMKSEVST